MDSQRKTKSVVLKTSTRQTIFLPVSLGSSSLPDGLHDQNIEDINMEAVLIFQSYHPPLLSSVTNSVCLPHRRWLLRVKAYTFQSGFGEEFFWFVLE